MKYILPRIQVFLSFVIKKRTKESIRVRTTRTFFLNFKAHLRQTPAFSHKNTQS